MTAGAHSDNVIYICVQIIMIIIFMPSWNKYELTEYILKIEERKFGNWRETFKMKDVGCGLFWYCDYVSAADDYDGKMQKKEEERSSIKLKKTILENKNKGENRNHCNRDGKKKLWQRNAGRALKQITAKWWDSSSNTIQLCTADSRTLLLCTVPWNI